MKRKISILFTLLTIFGCVLANSVFAAEKKKAKSKVSTAKLATENPFDTSVQAFSLKNTNNEMNLYLSLKSKSADFTKSEYESTSDFDARMNKICDKTLSGNLKYCDTVGFFTRTDIEYNYDADNKKMIVGVKTRGESIDTYYAKVGTKKYIASNAFGAKIKVTATEYLTTAVSMRRDEPKEEVKESETSGYAKRPRPAKMALYQADFYRAPRTISLDVPMTPEEAKDLKIYGGIVLIGKLYKPFIDNYTSHSKPTITEPTETIDDIRYVVIDPSEIWIVNTKTGKIYSREKIDLEISDYSRNIFIIKPIKTTAE